ncbi:uncharacterized protein SAPINGB_P004560 [Magnusiomyces paraingens]|uniref:Uncharacterized protein n=1 Tax=Magnusiomyces paraingens TaxID=2606893 RepID=A0A5E8C2J9_9ASCO|nr:uncharacterized protein SAPINGB_P004560 [Saprochaete ingens]VVT55365.1 unnamed protein product [Saprochaete ingens]
MANNLRRATNTTTTTNKQNGGASTTNFGMDGLAVSYEIYRHSKKTSGSHPLKKVSRLSRSAVPETTPRQAKQKIPPPAPVQSPYHKLVMLTTAITKAVGQTLGEPNNKNPQSAYRQLIMQQQNHVEPLAHTLHEFVDTLQVGLSRELLCTTQVQDKAVEGGSVKGSSNKTTLKKSSKSKKSMTMSKSQTSSKKRGALEEESSKKLSATPKAQEKSNKRPNLGGDSSAAVNQSKLSLKQKRLSMEGKSSKKAKRVAEAATDENTEPKSLSSDKSRPKSKKTPSKTSLHVEKASSKSTDTIIID